MWRKNLLKSIFILFLFFFLFGCVTTISESVWRRVGSFPDVTYDKVWSTAMDIVLEMGYDLSVVEGASGYLKTSYKQYGPDMGTFRRKTIEIKIDRAYPFDVKVRVSVKKYWGGLLGIPPQSDTSYKNAGNDSGLENKIMEELQLRLR